ncbi:hypothetical protein [Pyxidicoccus sp. MSG2]|uniref:hypothetical protein n=1 Tax=Pyxidicoccus sp. MSG2 TaxID=2996790 RepID=UPI00226E05E9|nr:hypothetical protein [Pyxidicoccus sp. MSG2]MCY1017092.1 hypothetical protein [Pyxidicoccus sp. MSG2]
MRRIPGLTWLSTALLMGCGGAGGALVEDEPLPQAVCNVTVSGAVTGTPACQDASLTYRETTDDFSLTLDMGTGSRPLVQVRPNANGRPFVGDFVGPTSEVDCAVTVRDGGKAWYPYYEDPAAGVHLRGSCTLTFTQVEDYIDSGTVVSYRFKGTMQVHLLPLESSGATGTVDVVVNFTL